MVPVERKLVNLHGSMAANDVIAGLAFAGGEVKAAFGNALGMESQSKQNAVGLLYNYALGTQPMNRECLAVLV